MRWGFGWELGRLKFGMHWVRNPFPNERRRHAVPEMSSDDRIGYNSFYKKENGQQFYFDFLPPNTFRFPISRASSFSSP
jgi:hypothetical protein